MESKYLLNFVLHFHDLNFYCMKFSIKVKYHAWMSVLLKEMATATSLKDKGKLKKKKLKERTSFCQSCYDNELPTSVET